MISGRVTATGGSALEGVRVSDGSSVTATDPDGRYELAGDGRFVFVVRPTGGRPIGGSRSRTRPPTTSS